MSTRSTPRTVLGWAIAIAALASPSLAREPDPTAATAGETTEDHLGESGHGKRAGRHHHVNELAVVVGNTWLDAEDEDFFTVGVEYVRLLAPRVSASFVAEHIDEVDALVFVAPVVFRPSHRVNLTLQTGPGVEHQPRRPDGGSEDGDSEDHFLWRVGVGYSFNLGKRLVLTPAIDLDFTRAHGEWERAVVADVAIGFGF